MDNDQRDEQCNTCHELCNVGWLENGTCINCLEIEEFGETMAESMNLTGKYN